MVRRELGSEGTGRPMIANAATQIRKKCLELCFEQRASHIGGALSVAEILAVLYGDPILSYDPSNPQWPGRDRFFYSKGHACTALYATLELCGFSQGLQEKFVRNGSYWTSHVNHHVPGVELSTGSLGHALPVAVGVSLAGLRKAQNWKVYCLLSDGELDEGSNWEALLFAPHHKLKNLCVIVDVNRIQSFGATKEVLDLEPLDKKFEAFGWAVERVDGHNQQALRETFLRFRSGEFSRPLVVIADTVKGKGVSFMENQLAWHYKSPSADQFKLAMEELGRP